MTNDDPPPVNVHQPDREGIDEALQRLALLRHEDGTSPLSPSVAAASLVISLVALTVAVIALIV